MSDMTWQQVVEAGNITGSKIEAMMSHTFLSWANAMPYISLVLWIGAIVVCVWKEWNYSDGFWEHFVDGTKGFFIGLLLAFLTTGPMVIAYGNQHDNIKANLVEAWKKNVAIPYIESLPQEKYPVKYIKLSPEMETKISGNRYYISQDTSKLTVLTFSYVEDKNGQKKLRTETDWVDTDMSLSNTTQPYVTLRELDHDLGNGIDAGNYDIQVWLPESYQFDTIK